MIDLMEVFFAIFEQEIFYDREYNYQNLEELTKVIAEYIRHCKEDRINEKLNSLTPKEYQTQAPKNNINFLPKFLDSVQIIFFA